jgi:hypothetical protein
MIKDPFYINIDFETRSVVDLPDCGAWVYSEHPSADIFCMAYRTADMKKTGLWLPGQKLPANFSKPNAVYVARYALFEYAMAYNVAIRKYGFPEQMREYNRWACTRAMSLAVGLPGSLEKSARALKVSLKSATGKALINKYSKPQKDRKTKELYFTTLEGDDAIAMYDYCMADIDADFECFNILKKLNNNVVERDIFLLDFKQNIEGLPVDVDGLNHVLTEMGKAQAKAETEMEKIGVNVRSPLQVKEYFKAKKITIPNLQADTVEKLLENPKLDKQSKELLILRQFLGKASVKKFTALARQTSPDNRLRYFMRYFGAHTGRFCVPAEAEVLTPAGWLSIDQWEPVKFDIMAYNPRDGRLIFEPGKAKHIFDVSENLIKFENRNISLMATENHKIGYFTGRGAFKIDTMASMLTRRKTVMPISGMFEAIKKTPLHIMQFFVMVQADGHYTKNEGDLKLGFKKQRKIDRCREILKKCGIKFNEYVFSSGARGFYIQKSQLPIEARRFNKVFGAEVLRYDLPAFIEEISFWDGFKQADSFIEYSTCNKINAEWVQTAAHLCGYSVRIVERDWREHGWALSYRVYIRKHSKTQVKDSDCNYVPFKGRVYCPEVSTGFFLVRYNGRISITGNSGSGFQPHNLPRTKLKTDNFSKSIAELIGGFSNKLERPAIIKNAQVILPGLIQAEKGKTFLMGDFAAIEARGIAYLAGETELLKAFANDEDVYKQMAAVIYNKPATSIKDGSKERQLGKQTILGCGYGMGIDKFKMTCEKYKIEISDDLAARAVQTYRQTYAKIRGFWYDLEGAFTYCHTNRRNKPVKRVGKHLVIKAQNNFISVLLPSGRELYYHNVSVDSSGLSYWNYQQDRRVSVYGGILAENITQALCRDILTYCMIESDRAGLNPILHVHDEIVCQIADKDLIHAFIKFETAMNTAPPWLPGFPLKTEIEISERYHK